MAGGNGFSEGLSMVHLGIMIVLTLVFMSAVIVAFNLGKMNVFAGGEDLASTMIVIEDRNFEKFNYSEVKGRDIVSFIDNIGEKDLGILVKTNISTNNYGSKISMLSMNSDGSCFKATNFEPEEKNLDFSGIKDRSNDKYINEMATFDAYLILNMNEEVIGINVFQQ